VEDGVVAGSAAAESAGVVLAAVVGVEVVALVLDRLVFCRE